MKEVYSGIKQLYDFVLNDRISIETALKLSAGMQNMKTMEEKEVRAAQIVELINQGYSDKELMNMNSDTLMN